MFVLLLELNMDISTMSSMKKRYHLVEMTWDPVFGLFEHSR